MSTLNLHVQYRPIKIGWCIRDNNFEDYKKAVQLSHTLWGGRYNPIIPIINTDSASELVNLFKVDLLYPVSNDKSITDFIDGYSHLPWPSFCEKELFTRWVNTKESAFLDIFQSALKLRSDLNKENSLEKIKINSIKWNESDPLSNVFNATFGCLPSQQEMGTEFDYNRLLAETLSMNNLTISEESFIDPSLLYLRTLNWLSSYLLNVRASRSIAWNSPGFYVGSAKKLIDLVNFWNLRACGISVLFYDPDHKDRLSEIKKAHVENVLSQPPATYEAVPSVGVWLQESTLDSFDRDEFKGPITICRVGSGSWNGMNIKVPTRHFKGKTVLGVLSNTSYKSLAFQLPSKPACDDTPDTNQYLIATVNIYAGMPDEDHTFNLPYIPELNHFYGQSTFEYDKFRIEPDGLGLIVRDHDESVHLNSINVKKLIEAIFKLHGMEIASSEPGIKAYRIIKQLGGLQNCRVFKMRGVRELIKKNTPYSSFSRGKAISTISQADSITNKTDFYDRYKALYLDGARVEPSIVFDYLTKKDVFRVGLELLCPNCNLKFWSLLDDLKSKSTCEFCGHDFNILTQLKDKGWLYRRSGIFGLEDNQAGGIPVVLTLNQLAFNSHADSFLYTTAMKIKIGTEKECETDFIVISWNRHGKVSIVLAECKTEMPIEQDDVENLKMVSDKLSNKYIESYMIFSKLAEFSEQEIEVCMSAQEPYRDRVILLTDRELESSYVYDRAKELYEVAQETSWETMVLNTKLIFQEKRRRSFSEPSINNVDAIADV